MFWMAAAILVSSLGADIESELIFPPNDKHNHGSSIVQTPEGDFIAAWFHGSGERTADDVMVQGARKRKGETAWSEPFIMADTPELPDCNPVLFIDPQGRLWLFWVAIQNNMWGGALLKVRHTKEYQADGPPNWEWQDVIHTRPVNLEEKFLKLIADAESAINFLGEIPGAAEMIETGKQAATDKLSRRLGWMTRIHPIMTSENRIMLGLYSDVFNCGLAAFTEDWGKTWTFSEPILYPQFNMLGNIQPSFAQRKNGDIMVFMRDNGIPKQVRTAISNDGGITWGDFGMLPIRDAGASVECIVLESGNWMLINNDQIEGRHRLSVHLSEDEGMTWVHRRSVEEAPPGEGSFSYPSMLQAQDGRVHATYSYTHKDVEGSSIKHAWFDEAWVMAGE